MWRYRSVRTIVWAYVKQKCRLSCGCSISQLLFEWGINVFVLPCENEDVGGKYTEIQSLLWEKIRYWIWIPKTEPWRSLEVFSLLSSPRWSDPEFYLNRITCVSCWWCCKNIELQSKSIKWTEFVREETAVHGRVDNRSISTIVKEL